MDVGHRRHEDRGTTLVRIGMMVCFAVAAGILLTTLCLPPSVADTRTGASRMPPF
jgi:hypothetical protein